MAYYTDRQVREAAERLGAYTTSGAEQALNKQAKSWRTSFDVFLSHAFLDAKLILGVKAILESMNLTVYVDWIDDPELDRTRVDSSTAARLRERMRQSGSMIFVTSRASVNSKWMPWELGYFDGLRTSTRIAIFPIVASSGDGFRGQEYLGLYPEIQQLQDWSSYREVPAVTRGGPWAIESMSMTNFVNGTGSFSATNHR
jgi:hypothetical protein